MPGFCGERLAHFLGLSLDGGGALEPEEDAKVMDWTRNAWARFRRHSHEGRLYLNFAGQDEASAALKKDAFGRNFNQLAAIKLRYDPENMFRFNQNILPG